MKHEEAIRILKGKVNDNNDWIRFYKKNLRRKNIPFCQNKKEELTWKKDGKIIIKDLQKTNKELKKTIKFLERDIN